MALVTLGSPPPARHVIGDTVAKFFVVNGASGSTLNTGMSNILWVDIQSFNQAGTATLVTGVTVSAGVITFTSSSAMVNVPVMVIGETG